MGLTDSSKVLGESVWAGTTPEGDYELDVFVEYSKYCYIKLKESINIYYREENGNHFIHYPPFDIWVSSGSKDGAYRKFAEKMLELWQEYGQMPDSELSPDNLNIKVRLMELVKEARCNN